MDRFRGDEINKLPNRKKLEMKLYKHFKWFYFKVFRKKPYRVNTRLL